MHCCFFQHIPQRVDVLSICLVTNSTENTQIRILQHCHKWKRTPLITVILSQTHRVHLHVTDPVSFLQYADMLDTTQRGHLHVPNLVSYFVVRDTLKTKHTGKPSNILKAAWRQVECTTLSQTHAEDRQCLHITTHPFFASRKHTMWSRRMMKIWYNPGSTSHPSSRCLVLSSKMALHSLQRTPPLNNQIKMSFLTPCKSGKSTKEQWWIKYEDLTLILSHLTNN